jgi:predicted nucleotidyltransferase
MKLAPAVADVRMATALAHRIVAAGRGRVRRVVMIGSRARGTPGKNSDLDLVVIVETPRGARRWGTVEFKRERERLQREVGKPPIATDLTVRSTDRYEEARRVIGGVEHLVDLEGIDLYRAALHRAPQARCSENQVRREHTSGWVQHAADTLDEAIRLKSDRTAGGNVAARAKRRTDSAIERALNALLVWHGILGTKADGADAFIEKLSAVDPNTAAELRAILTEAPASTRAAHAVLASVIGRLLEYDPLMRASLGPIQQRLPVPRGTRTVAPIQQRSDADGMMGVRT